MYVIDTNVSAGAPTKTGALVIWMDEHSAEQSHAGFADVAIAATARCHGLTILTGNARHFAPLGVPFLDPSALPAGTADRAGEC